MTPRTSTGIRRYSFLTPKDLHNPRKNLPDRDLWGDKWATTERMWILCGWARQTPETPSDRQQHPALQRAKRGCTCSQELFVILTVCWTWRAELSINNLWCRVKTLWSSYLVYLQWRFYSQCFSWMETDFAFGHMCGLCISLNDLLNSCYFFHTLHIQRSVKQLTQLFNIKAL